MDIQHARHDTLIRKSDQAQILVTIGSSPIRATYMAECGIIGNRPSFQIPPRLLWHDTLIWKSDQT